MKVSIIIPTYNRKKLLPACIESMLHQTYRDLEIIVVDDASTDGTQELFSTTFTDPRIRFIRLEKNLGVAGARNAGLDIMTGELFSVWDSDDILYPDAVESCVAILTSDETIGAVSAPSIYLRDGKEVPIPRVSSGVFSFKEKLNGALPENDNFWVVRSKYLGSNRFKAANLDFVFVDRLFKVCGKWYHLDRYIGEYKIISDKNSLTSVRKKANPTLSIERARALSEYLEEFMDDFRQLMPHHLANVAYGIAVGMLLDGQWRVGLKHAYFAFRYWPNRPKYVLFFVFALIPISPSLLHALFWLRVHKVL